MLDSIAFLSEFVSSSQETCVNKRGGPRNIVFFGNPDAQILIQLELAMDEGEIAQLSEMLPDSVDSASIRATWEPKWIYEISLGWLNDSFSLLSESIRTWVKGQRIEFARGSWQEKESSRMYYYEVIESIANGFAKGIWNLRKQGGGAPATSLLASAKYQKHKEWYPIKKISDYLTNVSRLNEVRASPEEAKLVGQYQLAPNAENLPQVLHSLASSRRRVFDAILKDATSLIPELSEVLSQPVEGTDTARLSVTERAWPNSELLWRNISSGERETIYLLTLLHLTPNGTLLLIEEPGLNLHSEAIIKLRGIIERVASTQRKQVIATTHSLTLIDNLPFRKIAYLRNTNGASDTLEIRNYEEVESLLNTSLIHKSDVLVAPESLLIVVVEGRDDVKIYRQFFSRGGIDIESNSLKIASGLRSGGREEVLAAISFLNKLGPPISYYAVLDGDGQDELHRRLSQEGIPEENVHFLSKGEIESYLADPSAIAALTNRSTSEVEAVLSETRGRGKEQLEAVLQGLGVSKASSEVKELLVCHLPEIPDEMQRIITVIKSKLKNPAKDLMMREK